MRRGIAYMYLSLIIVSAVALALLAVYSTYVAYTTNTLQPTEVWDREDNFTAIKMASHYCAARASTDRELRDAPTLGKRYNITDPYNLFARASGKPAVGALECYNVELSTYSNTSDVYGVRVSTIILPEDITFTVRLDNLVYNAEYDADVLVVVRVTYSLGVADYEVRIYYNDTLKLRGPGGEVLNVTVPIKGVHATLSQDGDVTEYPVNITESDRPGYKWVITTSFVIDPTEPQPYNIRVEIFMYNGVKHDAYITVSWD